METKTIREFLDSLTGSAKINAYDNLHEEADLNEQVESMAEALCRSFDQDFDHTPEGFKYWYDIVTAADHDYQIRLHQERGLDYSHLING